MRLRIASWNVENLTPRLVPAPASAPHGLRASLARLGAPDVLCLQEIRLRTVDKIQVEVARAALPGYACALSLPRDPRNVTFRGGRAYGVATYVHARLGEVAASVPDWDREGRVVVAELAEQRLAIVNLYAVNGTGKPYVGTDGAIDGDRHAFKRRVQVHLAELGAELRARGLGVIMIGDWNVSQTAQDIHPRLRTAGPHAAARAQLRERFLDEPLGFVDVWRAAHPDARGYTWFNPRSRALDAARVDFALVSPELARRVTSTEILDAPEQRPATDHAPIAIELDLA